MENNLQNNQQNPPSKNIVGLITFIVVALVVGTLAYFLVSSGFNQNKVSQTNNPHSGSNTSAVDAFKTNYKNSFIQSCEKTSSGQTAICTCSADYMITNYTDAELTQITSEYQSTGKIPQALTNAINSCNQK